MYCLAIQMLDTLHFDVKVFFVTIPFPLFFVEVTSAMIALEIVTLPLDNPPMILAMTKKVKFHEYAQTA